MTGPREEEVLRAGGWSGRYAKVLAVAFDDATAIALVDTNGDERLVELEELWLDDTGRWQPGGSSGSEPTWFGWCNEGLTATGIAYAYGRTRDAEVTMYLNGRVVTVPVGPGGWWACVAE